MIWRTHYLIFGTLAVVVVANGQEAVSTVSPKEVVANVTEKPLASVRVFQLQGMTRLEGVKAKSARRGILHPSKWTPRSALLIVSNEDFSAYSELGMQEWFEKLGLKMMTSLPPEQSSAAAKLFNAYREASQNSEPTAELSVSYCEDFIRNVTLPFSTSIECLDSKASVNSTNTTNSNSTSERQRQPSRRCKRFQRPWRQYEEDPYFTKRSIKPRQRGKYNESRSSHRLSWEHHVFINWERLIEDDVLTKWETVKKCEKVLENAREAEEEAEKRKKKYGKEEKTEDDEKKTGTNDEDKEKEDDDDDEEDEGKKRKKFPKMHDKFKGKKDRQEEHKKKDDKAKKNKDEEDDKDPKRKKQDKFKGKKDNEDKTNPKKKDKTVEEDNSKKHKGRSESDNEDKTKKKETKRNHEEKKPDVRREVEKPRHGNRPRQENRQDRRKSRRAPFMDVDDDIIDEEEMLFDRSERSKRRPWARRLPPHPQAEEDSADEDTWDIPPRKYPKRKFPTTRFFPSK